MVVFLETLVAQWKTWDNSCNITVDIIISLLNHKAILVVFVRLFIFLILSAQSWNYNNGIYLRLYAEIISYYSEYYRSYNTINTFFCVKIYTNDILAYKLSINFYCLYKLEFILRDKIYYTNYILWVHTKALANKKNPFVCLLVFCLVKPNHDPSHNLSQKNFFVLKRVCRCWRTKEKSLTNFSDWIWKDNCCETCRWLQTAWVWLSV